MDSLRENHKEFKKSSKLIPKSYPGFTSAKHNIFTVKVNKIVLSANNDNRIQ